VSVHYLQPSEHQRWEDFVNAAPGAHAYHRAGWSSVIERAFGQQTYKLISEDPSGRVNGVLPLARLRSRLFGDFLVSLPYLNYGGPCAIDAETESRLVDEAVRLAREESVQHLELRLTAPEGFGLHVKASKVSMRLPLAEDADSLWKSFPSKLRNQVNRPIKEGMVARVGGLEELDAFYRVFSINMRDLGTPVYSRAFFETVLREFGPDCRIVAVYYQNQPVASGFLVGFKDTLEIPWASSLRSVNRLAPNMLLYWTVLKYAADQGYRVFDFGRSSPDAGTYRFKEQWGAKPLPLYWHYWVRPGGKVPDLSPANPKYRVAIDIWKRLPLSVTNLIGPAIVRNIP
jgi:FemAB-related protein (PEP-CTERM system-associated)